MGSNCKSYGGGKSCGCNKRVKKAQRVPQRGPGVAELEKILSDQKQDHMKPLYPTPNNLTLYNQPHYHLQRPPTQHQLMIPRLLPECHYDASGNMYLKPGEMNYNSSNDLSFTQMMMMGDNQYPDSKSNTNLVFQTNMMSNPRPSFNHFNKLSPSRRDYNKCPSVSPKEESSHPSQRIIENGRAIDEHEKMKLRNIFTLGPPSPTEGSSTIFIDSDRSKEQYNDKKQEISSDKSHQSQIFGVKLTDKFISLDETKLSLHHNAALAEDLSLDLTLKL